MKFKDQLVYIPENANMRFGKIGANSGLYLTVHNPWKDIHGNPQTNKYEAAVIPSISDDFTRLFKVGSYLYISGHDSQYIDKHTGRTNSKVIITGYNTSKEGFFGDD